MQPLSKIPLTTLKGVGDKVAKKLEKLGLVTVNDAIFHLPARYEDRTQVYRIAYARPGVAGHFQVTVDNADIKYGRKRMLVCRVRDETGTMTLRFSNLALRN